MPRGGLRPHAKCHPRELNHAHGLCSTCYRRHELQTKEEVAERQRARWREKYGHPRYRRYHKNRKPLWTYGISLRDYERLLKKQKGRCAICSLRRLRRKDRNLMVDHSHRTQKVRGLLCHRCNWTVGLIESRPDLFKRTLKYLEQKGELQFLDL